MVASAPAFALGALLGGVLTLFVVQRQDRPPLPVRGNARKVFYENTVMQNGACNITKEDNLSIIVPNPEFPHVIATGSSPHYGLHVMVLGRDSKIYHKHQIAPGANSNWTAWKCLTPDFTKVPCSMMPHCQGYDNQPVMAWQPENGTLVAFVRQMDDLVPHQFYLTDPKDPDSWSTPRGPVCLCNYPPCKDKGQTKCGVVSECDNLGKDCSKVPDDSRDYYGYGPLFPTSELSLIPDFTTNQLTLYWRGFDGHYYSVAQNTAGDAGGKWGGTNGSKMYMGDNGIIE